MPQFEVATFPSQIFWLLVCFVFLCIVMGQYLVPRLTSALEAREQRLQEDLAQAKAFLLEEDILKKENQLHLTQARAKAHTLIHQTLHEAYHNKTSRIATLDEALLIQTKEKRENLEIQIQKIRQNMEPIVFQVMRATASQILGQSLTHSHLKVAIKNVLKKQE